MNSTLGYSDFSTSKTSKQLCEILEERSNYFYFAQEGADLLTRIDEFLSSEGCGEFPFDMDEDNGSIDAEVVQAGFELIELGRELVRLAELWKGKHILGEDATLIEKQGRWRLGTTAVVGDDVVVFYADERFSLPLGGEKHMKVARRLL